MNELIFFILGCLLTLVLVGKPIKLTVHHKYENVNPPLEDLDMDALEQKMLKEDPNTEQSYKDLDKTIEEINNIMGGSDRV